MAIIKKGEAEIPGLTDNTVPRRLGPKRASKIRKLFNLTPKDDVCQYVIKRPLPQKEGKKQRFKAPKIQRLITPVVLPVRHQEASSPEGGQEAEVQGPQDPASHHPRGSAAQEAEGSQGGPRAEEEEVRLPEGVQALRQQQVDHPREQRRVDSHSFDLRRGYTHPTSCRVPC